MVKIGPGVNCEGMSDTDLKQGQQHEHERELKHYDTLHETGRRLAQGCVLINAGAAAAMLTLLGTLAGKDNAHVLAPAIAGIASQQFWFIVGIFLGALSHVCVYAGLYCHHHAHYKKQVENSAEAVKRWGKRGGRSFKISFFVLVGSLLSFGVGAWQCRSEFQKLAASLQNVARNSSASIQIGPSTSTNRLSPAP